MTDTNQEIVIVSKEESNRYRNLCLLKVVIPFVLQKVLAKVSTKKNTRQSYWSYLNSNLGITQNEITGEKYDVSSTDFENLREHKDTSKFGCSLLFSMIEAIDNEAHARCKPSNEFKPFLQDVKGIWSKISLDVDAGMSSFHYTDAKEKLSYLLRNAESVYDQGEYNIDEELQELETHFEKIDKCKKTDLIEVYKSYFLEISVNEMRNRWDNDCSFLSIPLLNAEVFDSLYTPLKIRCHNECCSSVEESALLTSNAEVSILCGETGSGKSTLLQNITRHFLGLSKHSPSLLTALRDVDTLCFLDCRGTTYKTLEEYLSGTFPEVVKYIGRKNLAEVIFQVHNCLLLIDSFDEISNSSMDVLNELLEHVKTSGNGFKIIITARTHLRENGAKLVAEKGLKYELFNILKIDDLTRKLEFLEKYEAVFAVGSFAIREKFCNLPKDVTSYLKTPVLLVWFCYLIQNDFTNTAEWSTVADVSSQIVQHYAKSVEKRLLCNISINTNKIFKEALEIVGALAFKSLAANTLSVTAKEMTDLIQNLSRILISHQVPANISVMTVVSCMLQVRKLLSGEFIYYFIHLSHQEAFAAEALASKLHMQPLMTLRTAVCELSQSDNPQIYEK